MRHAPNIFRQQPSVHALSRARWPSFMRSLSHLFCLLSLLCLCAWTASAMPLASYRERVRKSADALDAMNWSADEDATEATRAESASATLKGVREALLTVETVEWSGGALRVDNSWLDEALKDYEKMNASDPRRPKLLLRIEERLYALDQRLAEVEQREKGRPGSAGKDEEKARLAAILRRDEYSKKAEEESALASLLRRLSKWLNDLFPDVKPINPAHASTVSRIVQIVVIVICLAIIALLLRRYVPGLLNRRASKKREPRKARVVLGERLEADQTASDLLAEAEALARKGELRAAIRKGYIALLCELGDRKILSLAQSKTNRDYLRALRDRESLHSEMRQLTDMFENHWYGLAPATSNDWTDFRARYERALKEG